MRHLFIISLLSLLLASYHSLPAQPITAFPSPDSIEVLNKLSREFLDKNPIKALDYGRRALKASQRLNLKSGTARALNNLGTYYRDQGEIDVALKYFSNSLRISKEIQDTVLIVRSLSNIARVFSQQRVTGKAMEYFQEALSLSRKSRDTLAMSHTLNCLGAMYYQLNAFDVSMEYFQKALIYRKQENDLKGIATSLNNIGLIHQAKKEYDKALKCMFRSMEILKRNESVKNLSHTHLNIGKIYELMGNYDKAWYYYDQGLQAALQINATAVIIEAYGHLANHHARLKNYKDAYHYKNLFATYSDSLFQQEVAGQISELINQLELEKKEKEYNLLLNKQEIRLLNKENLIQKLELKEKRSQSYFLIGGFVLITFFSILLLIAYRGKMRLNDILKEKNKRNSSQNQELKKINDKLARSEAELRELNTFKDKFFSIIGHDLKSPLNTLLGLLKVLKKDFNSFTEEELKLLTSNMERSLRGLSGLLDNLLQWSLSQMNNLKVVPELVNLTSVIEENVLLLESNATFKNLQIQVTIDKQLFVFADINMIKLVFRNLISNAIKFTPKGGRIIISAGTEKFHTKIFVRDNGIGISENNQKKLFSIGERYSIKGTNNEKGTGLGLIICKEFIEQNKGKISLESKADEGTTFIITLPNRDLFQDQMESSRFSLN